MELQHNDNRVYHVSVDEVTFFSYLGCAIFKLRISFHPYSDSHSTREHIFVREYKLYINGEFRDASDRRTFTATNPFNQETIATFARASVSDTQAAIRSARDAFDSGPCLD